MTRRDVDLVIRARDQAQRTLTDISKALSRFNDEQADFRQNAERTDGALSRLGSALSQLRNDFGGLGATARAAQELAKAQAAVQRLATEVDKAEQDFNEYTASLARAGAQTERLQASFDRTAAAVSRQEATVARARQAQAALAQATRENAQAQARNAAGQERLSAQIVRQLSRLATARERYADLSRQISATENPTKRLSASFEASARAVARARDRLESLRRKQAQLAGDSQRAAQAAQQASDAYGRQARSLTRTEAALTSLRERQKQLQQALRASAVEQNRLEGATDRAADALRRQQAAFSQAQAEVGRLRGAASQVEGALRQLEQTVRGPILRAFGEQRRILAATREAYQAAQQRAQALGRQFAETARPSAQLVAAFEAARQAVNRGQEEYRRQQQALQTLRATLRETGGDLEAFVARQQRAAAALAGSRRGLEEVRADSRRAADATRRLSEEQARAEAQERRRRAGLTSLGGALRRATREQNAFSSALRRFYGEGRQALSFTQRLRSEVLSLIAAYGGIFAAVQGVRNTVTAFQELEAAQNRLNFVFDGDDLAISDELDFIRRTAERLGVQFGVLAREYTKFAVASKNTNLEGENTRRIFRAVVEAGRAQNLTLDQIQGTFTALTQIVSKGTLSLEELRQQLGDRLPGALQIFADGLGVTAGELIKLIENGEVSSASLVNFAEELERRFSGSLEGALTGVTAQIGRFQNALFQTFLVVGESGAIEGFIDLLKSLTETLQSAEFVSFAQRIGEGLGTLFTALGAVTENFDLLIIALTTFLGLKIAPFVAAFAATLIRLPAIIRLTRIRMVALSSTLSATGTAFAAAATTVARLRVALVALLSSTGIGLLVTLIGTGIGIWATRADEATASMIEHRRIVDDVRNAYENARGSVDAWVASLQELNITQLRGGVARLRQDVRDLGAALRELADDQVGAFGTELTRSIDELISSFRIGDISAQDLSSALTELFEAARPPNGTASAEFFDRVAEEFLNIAQEAVKTERQLEELDAALKGREGTAEEAAEAFQSLADDTAKAGDAAARSAEDTQKFEEAIKELQEFLPGAADELERLQRAANLDEAAQSAVRFAQGAQEVADVLKLIGQARTQLDVDNLFAGASSSEAISQTVALLRRFEGFLDRARFDVNAFRVGFGSDTTTDRDGTVRRVTSSTVTTEADALRDLVRRISEFRAVIEGQIGATRFEQFSPRQQAALTSIAYNYGQLPARIVEAVRTGTVDEIDRAIRGLSGDNEGVNRRRRNQEADIIAAGGGLSDQPLIEAERERLRLIERQNEEQRRANETTQQTIADQQFQLDQQGLLNRGAEREAAIARAVRDARQENADITAQQLAQVAQNAGRLFDEAEAAERAADARERADRGAEDTSRRLAANEEALRLQELVNAGKAREAAIERAVLEAKAQNAGITAQQLDQIREQAGRLFDLQVTERKRAREARRGAEATRQTLTDQEFQIRQQQLINQGKEREAAIERAIRDAKNENANISQRDLDLIGQRAGRLFDLSEAQKGSTAEARRAEEIEGRVNSLLSLRQTLQQELTAALRQGQDADLVGQLRQQLEGVNAQLQESIENALKLLEALGSSDPAVAQIISRLRTLQTTSEGVARGVFISFEQVANLFANNLVNAANKFAESLAEGRSVTASLRIAFLQFAADFLRQIANMILQQLALNAAKSFGRALGFGVAHSGGIIGRRTIQRKLDPAAFYGAVRYHAGGIAGLRPGEVPTILQAGEEVLTRNDPRHAFNLGRDTRGATAGVNLKIVNQVASGNVVDEGLRTREGEGSFMNTLGRRPSAARATLNIGASRSGIGG